MTHIPPFRAFTMPAIKPSWWRRFLNLFRRTPPPVSLAQTLAGVSPMAVPSAKVFYADTAHTVGTQRTPRYLDPSRVPGPNQEGYIRRELDSFRTELLTWKEALELAGPDRAAGGQTALLAALSYGANVITVRLTSPPADWAAMAGREYLVAYDEKGLILYHQLLRLS